MNTYVYLWEYVAEFFLGDKRFRKKFRENQNTFYIEKTFPKIVPGMR